MKGLFIQTYGCQMNSSDSERMKAVLAPVGYESVSTPEQADLILINTCSIRDKAELKTEHFSAEIKGLKRTQPDLKIGVTGCVAQQEKEKILEKLPWVDLVLGPDNIDELPWLIDELAIDKNRKISRAVFDQGDERVWNTETKILNPGPIAFVNVMKGCDHFCSYCIVPYTRGREKSRPIADIVRDVKTLCAQGVREITFLGQNINTYGKRNDETLHELFHRVHEIEDLKRIRFTTSHPGDLKDELIRCYEELPKLSSYFHLPVQSGSNRILRAMRRFYTKEQYLDRVKALRQARPDIAFSTDIIIGFPGESEEDFLETMELADTVKFDNSYSFIFSPRPGTSAATLKDTLTEAQKSDRLTRMQNRLRYWSKTMHEQEIGKIKEILIEGPSKKDPSRFTGRTSQNVPVHFLPQSKIQKGDLINLFIESATLTHLKGVDRVAAEALCDPAGVPNSPIEL